LISKLLIEKNITIYSVTREQYPAATELAQELKLEPNDALGVDIMEQNSITRTYTYDEDFNNIQEITKLITQVKLVIPPLNRRHHPFSHTKGGINQTPHSNPNHRFNLYIRGV
jgi:hypothetical protein